MGFECETGTARPHPKPMPAYATPADKTNYTAPDARGAFRSG